MTVSRLPIKDVCADVVVGHVGPSSSHRTDDGVPFLMGKNVGAGFLKLGDLERVSQAFHRAERKSQLRPGDVVVVRIGESGQAAKIPETLGDANCSGLVVIKQPHKVTADYLVHFLNSAEGRRQSLAQAKGSTRQTLNTASIAAATIPVPTLPEQRRIVEVLDRAEALRATRRAALALLDALTYALFLDMFGDPTSNPRGWPVRTIGELLQSASYGTSEKAAAVGEFPVLRMNNITRSGAMDFTDLKFMDLGEAQHDRYLVRAGDLLFNRTNSADLVGKTAIFRCSRPMAYAGYLIRLRVNADNDPEYLAAFLNTRHAKAILRGMCKSIIGMANINATELQSIKIPEPPLRLQREFARRVAAVEKLRVAYGSALHANNGLCASLQDLAFRGKL